MKLKVDSVRVEEGSLYGVSGECGPLNCFCCGVVARAAGKWYRHSTFVVMGHEMTEDGWNVPNWNAKNEAEAFARKVEARGEIALAHWEPVQDPPSLEAVLADEYVREQCERMGIAYPPV
jgi:hypothetical protein